jgi:hypothetical protein
VKQALALMAGALLWVGCANSPVPRLTSVGSPEAALEQAGVLAEEGRWAESLSLLVAARREYPEDAVLAAEEQRVRQYWAELKARLEDRLAAVRSQGRQDEIALLEPLVIAEPQRLSRAWTLDSRKRAQREARDELLRCAERQLEADPALAVSCLDLSEAIEVDARSQLVRQDIERRETERAALEAAEEARERERSMERKKRLRKRRIGQAEALAAAGNYADASAEVDKVLAEEPENARALALRIGLDQIMDLQNRVLGELASSLYADGELDAAIQVWETLVIISPDHAEAQERLERAKRVRDNLTQVREQQSEPESGGEADVIKISPTQTGPGADPPLSPGQQEAEPLKAGDENRAR